MLTENHRIILICNCNRACIIILIWKSVKNISNIFDNVVAIVFSASTFPAIWKFQHYAIAFRDRKSGFDKDFDRTLGLVFFIAHVFGVCWMSFPSIAWTVLSERLTLYDKNLSIFIFFLQTLFCFYMIPVVAFSVTTPFFLLSSPARTIRGSAPQKDHPQMQVQLPAAVHP